MSDRSTPLAVTPTLRHAQGRPELGRGTSVSRGDRAWYRSLYWRIALGLVVFLALLLGAQGLLYIYLTDRLAGSMPARSPRELAVNVASDVSSALTRDPALDLAKYIHTSYDHVFQPIVIVMRDGRVV